MAAPVSGVPLTLPRRPISAIVADLSRPLPPACVAKLPATNKREAQEYLHWYVVTALLDTYAPGWEGSVVRVEKIGEKIAVTYRLTIPAAEGPCSREDTGMEDEDKDSYGDAMTNAIATALKRAAAKFGLGVWLYVKDGTHTALLAHLRQERVTALAELRKVVDAQGLDAEEVLTALLAQTGAASKGVLPLPAIQAFTSYLLARSCPPSPPHASRMPQALRSPAPTSPGAPGRSAPLAALPAAPAGPAWETLRAHVRNPDLSEHLRDQVEALLATPDVPVAEAFALAAAVLDSLGESVVGV